MNLSYSSLVLGTAQFGFPYGIANKTGQPNQKMATAIVREAWKNGIREFDTAQGYGDSELVLGEALAELELSQKAKIISKFDPNLDHLNAEVMSRALDQSLHRLGVPRLFGVMLHREKTLSLWDKGLSKILHDLVLSGLVHKVGVSVYSSDKAIQALNTQGIDMVQLPTNILDRRFEKAGVFHLAEKKKKQIYIRSVFLQGLILMNPEEVPEQMAFTRPVIKKIELLSKKMGLSQQEVALGYIRAEMPNAKIIFGADIPEHINENRKCWEKDPPSTLIREVIKLFDQVDEKVLNPTLWPS